MILTVRFGIWIRVVDLDRCTAEGAWVANTIIGPEDDRASTLGSFGRVDADLPGEWYCSEEQLRRRLVSVSWSNDESKWRSWYGPCLLAEPDMQQISAHAVHAESNLVCFLDYSL